MTTQETHDDDFAPKESSDLLADQQVPMDDKEEQKGVAASQSKNCSSSQNIGIDSSSTNSANTRESELTNPNINLEINSAGGENIISGIEELNTGVKEIEKKIERMQETFESKLRYDETKDRLLDSLHKELGEHKEDFYFKIMCPLVLDLITELYDDMNHLVRHAQPSCATENITMANDNNLCSYIQIIESILERYGISAYSEDNGAFSPKRQRAIKIVATDLKEQDRHVAESLKKGFSYNGNVIRLEQVSTYKYTNGKKSDLDNGDAPK
jgi:molecular chaperone GrpE